MQKETMDEIQKSTKKTTLRQRILLRTICNRKKNRTGNAQHTHRSLNIQTLLDTFHHYMISELLKWSCIAFSDQRISNINYEIPTLQPILQLIEDGKYDEIPSIQVYYLVYKTLTQEQETDFKN
ncbi:MAG: hypothetical protein IPL21_11670 [Saprospirales bacterium]|nr:hypothetical protein [Saprospirales bacterium]